jgi:hypothetical protein
VCLSGGQFRLRSERAGQLQVTPAAVLLLLPANAQLSTPEDKHRCTPGARNFSTQHGQPHKSRTQLLLHHYGSNLQASPQLLDLCWHHQRYSAWWSVFSMCCCAWYVSCYMVRMTLDTHLAAQRGSWGVVSLTKHTELQQRSQHIVTPEGYECVLPALCASALADSRCPWYAP